MSTERNRRAGSIRAERSRCAARVRAGGVRAAARLHGGRVHAARIHAGLKQRPYQGVAPQSDFSGHGLEHRVIAAVDQRDGAGAGFEQRRLDGICVEAAQGEFDFITGHFNPKRRSR